LSFINGKELFRLSKAVFTFGSGEEIFKEKALGTSGTLRAPDQTDVRII
jgi:hypothetical protein